MPGLLDTYCACFVKYSEWTCAAPPSLPREEGSPDSPAAYSNSYPPASEVYHQDQHQYMIISYCVCVFCVVAIACYGMWVYTRQLTMRHKDMSTDEFCTARGTQGMARISYAFFGSAVGAWVITAPASFAVWVGWVGLVSYSISAGLPILVLALCGALIQNKHKNILSVGDFVGRRFGPVFKTMTCFICIFVMAIAMLAEYTTIGALFQDYVGSVNYPMVIVVGVLTMMYTAYGGLMVSIATDQVQAISIIILLTVLVIYVAVTFREPLPTPVPNDANIGFPLGANKAGYGTIFSLPVSLMSATVFSEAMWQKVWASKDRKSLIGGGIIGCLLTIITVFLFGFAGWLAAWGGLVTNDTNINLYLFQVFAAEQNVVVGASAMVSSWVGIIVLMLATIMNTSAIDSLQNGICSAISSQWFKDQHIMFPRIWVVVVNVPLIVVSLQNYPIINLFLISNMITTCCFIPVLIGILTDKIVSESAAIFSVCTAVLTSLAYGIGNSWDGNRVADSFECGAWYTFFGNQNFEYLYFLFACAGSIAGLLIWEISAFLLRKVFNIRGPGISGVLAMLPGFKFITGESCGFDMLDVQPFKFLVMGKLHGPLHAKGRDSESTSPASDVEPAAGTEGPFYRAEGLQGTPTGAGTAARVAVNVAPSTATPK